MKRRLFALLAVPALALGFALASPGADEAHALVDPGMGISIYCGMQKQAIATAEYWGDEVSAGQIYAEAQAAGCNPWYP